MSGIVKWGGGFLAVMVTLALISAVFVDPPPAPQPPPPPPEPVAIDVEARALFAAYHENEVAADLLYKGKSLRVTGKMQAISKDAFDKVVIRLDTTNQFLPVDAYIAKDEEAKAATLHKGEKITLVCEGGGMTIGRPTIRACRIR